MKKAPLATALCLLAPFASAQGIAASLVANDAITATLFDPSTNTTIAQQSQPAGPLWSANLQVGSYAVCSCSLAQLGSTWQFLASSQAIVPPNPVQQGITHADLLLTLTGTGTIALDLSLAHLGDQSDPTVMRIDVGNDGSVEVNSGPIGSPWHHRLWTWDFAQGSLPIRVRTDQVSYGGAQRYDVNLRVLPWAAGASPAAPGCPFVATIRDGQGWAAESTNYQLAALPSTAPQQFATLRAFGLGQFGLFLVAVQPAIAVVPIPAPFYPSSSVPLLVNAIFMQAGTVTANVGIVTPVIPRTWEVPVPLLPPGLTFWVQHTSATLVYPQQVGTTNVIRFDT
jgi:hypothetical protein